MVDETDVPNYNNLSSNNGKMSLSFKKSSYTVDLTLAKQCRPFDDGNFFLNSKNFVKTWHYFDAL